MKRDLSKVAMVKNSPKRIAAFYDYLRENVEELDGMVPGMLEGPRLRPAAASQLECLSYVARRPDFADFLKQSLKEVKGWVNPQLAQELGISLRLEKMRYAALLKAGYNAHDLESLMAEIPLRSPLGRIGFTSEILSVIDNEVLARLKRIERVGKVPDEPPRDMRKAKRRIVALTKRLAALEKALSEFVTATSPNSDDAAFILRSLFFAGARPGLYRSEQVQLDWLRRRAVLLQLELEFILNKSPKAGRIMDPEESANLGEPVEDSPQVRIAAQLGRAWIEWVGSPPTRKVRRKDAGRRDGVLDSISDGPFLRIVTIVMKPLNTKRQSFDAIVRKVVESLSAEVTRARGPAN